MRKTKRKIFWAWEHDKEEKWLNEMSAKGLQLCGVGLCTYVFEESEPGEYIYRLEMLNDWPSHFKSVDYIRFVEDTGAQQIGSVYRWVYFRKKASAEGFDIFSDIESRIKHLNRILFLAGVIAAVNLLNGSIQLRQWVSGGRQFSLIIACLCLGIGLLIGYGFLTIHRKRRKLKKEQLIRE